MEMKIGQAVFLKEVCDPVLASRFISMGIFPGATLTLIRSTLGGSCYILQADKHFFALRQREVAALVTSTERNA